MQKLIRAIVRFLIASVLIAGLASSAWADELPGRPEKRASSSKAKRQRAKLLVIINGESNSGGYALNTEATPAELAPRPSVRILNNDTLTSFDVLDIGTNNVIGHTGLPPNATHGFELALANRADQMQARFLPVLLVKTGHGGSTIAQWAAGGAYYTTFLKRVAAAKQLLKDEEVRPVVLFSLGINDAIAGTKLEVWKPAVKSHFEAMRKELGADTPIVMTKFMPAYAAYNAAIDEICNDVPNTYAVNTLDAPLRDANHWNYVGMKLVANRMFDVLDQIDTKSKKKSK